MYTIQDVEQSNVLGHMVVISMRITDEDRLPRYAPRDKPDRVALIKRLRRDASTSLRDGKTIIDLLLAQKEVVVKLLLRMDQIPVMTRDWSIIGVEVRCINTDPIDRNEYKHALLSMVPQLPQRQDSTSDQLEDMVMVAHKLGMYDAADVIRKLLEDR